MQAKHIDKKDFIDYKEFLGKHKELVQKWAKVEHLRWNAFHSMNG
jgi:hypothetical protein